MILTVCLSPCIDVTVEVDALEVGKTNIVKRKRCRAGGKAFNVALGVSRLKEEAFLTGFSYREGMESFENLLREYGVGYRFLQSEGRVRENYKFIDHRSMLTEVNDVGAPVSRDNLVRLLTEVSALSQESDVVVVSGGLPRGVPSGYYADIFRSVSPRCFRVADATDGKLSAALEAGVDLVKPNREELEYCVGRELHTTQERLDACRELVARGTKYVLLSLGKEGAIITDGRESYFCKSACVAVNSTVGAGDAMVAAAAIGLKNGASMPEILRSGTAAGSAAISTFDDYAFSAEKYAEIYESLQVVPL